MSDPAAQNPSSNSPGNLCRTSRPCVTDSYPVMDRSNTPFVLP